MKNSLITILISLLSIGSVFAAADMANGRISDILNTKHNFSAGIEPILPGSETRTVSAISEQQLCVFCHTPHGDRKNSPGDISDSGPFATSKPFLWNRQDSSEVYTMYSSSSLDIANNGQTPGTGSKMCLSCHDGTVAVGQVNVLNSRLSQTIAMQGTVDGGKLAPAVDGYTSNLGGDLSNDHPVGFVYNAALASADGELIDPDAGEGSHIGIRVGSGVAVFNNALQEAGLPGSPNAPTTTSTRIAVPLESNASSYNKATKTDFVSISASGSVECTSCHDPHIRSTDFSENIKFLRLHRFQKNSPTGSFDKNSDINCLACHKKEGWVESVHADQSTASHRYSSDESAKREIPANTEVWETSCNACHDPHSVTGAKHLMRQSNIDNTATDHDINKTCFECHGNAGVSVLDSPTTTKDIQTLGGHSEFNFDNNKDDHQITNGDFEETQASLQNRHVSCTDCHNPHRAAKNSAHNLTGNATQSTHVHDSSEVHSNIASGSLRGISGVEPNYDLAVDQFVDPYAFSTLNFTLLAGIEPSSTNVVTKEYQVCMKCHSNYGIADSDRLAKNFRNIAEEFKPKLDTRGANHNSWHPVAAQAASAAGITTVSADNFVAPFNNPAGVGEQTMYCSDCHGSSDVASTVSGPHGSTTPKQLIAPWSETTGLPSSTGDLCFTCHKFEQYAADIAGAETPVASNFGGTGAVPNNLHLSHATAVTGYSCTLCHTKSSHGWKNKGLLVDLSTDTAQEILDAKADGFYGNNVELSIDNYKAPGTWEKVDCASSGCHL